jgi:hypothetical protein
MDVEGAEASETTQIGDRFYVLPTQIEGQRFDPLQRYYNTGEFLGGPFPNEQSALDWERYFLGYVGGEQDEQ